MNLDHVGYLTTDIINTISEFSRFGDYQSTEIIQDDGILSEDGKKRNVQICFLYTQEGHNIELVSPIGNESVVNSILKRQGPGPYHFCYQVEDLENEMKVLLSSGYILVHEPLPAIAFQGRRVCFLFSPKIGLVELLESGRNAGEKY